MSLTLNILIWIAVMFQCQSQMRTPIRVYQLGINTSHVVGSCIINAVSIAINEINDRQDILPNYELQTQVFDYKKDNLMAIDYSKYITQQKTNKLSGDISLTSPLILGPPWSSTSRSILPILNAYNFGLLSSFATSSDLRDYPYFYRTVPDEEVQTKALLLFCKKMNWDKIGILYLHNINGVHLNQLIVEQAVNINDDNFTMDITSFPYFYENIDDPEFYPMGSIKDEINENNVYILILIARYVHLPFIITELGGYPTYFIGVDWWMEENVIQKADLTKYVQGYIGTYPLYPKMLPLHVCTTHRSGSSQLLHIYNKSNIINNELDKKWNFRYNQSIYARFGYDAAYALAHALDIFDKEYGLNLLSLTNLSSNSFIIKALHEILLHNVSFIGSTGTVSFDSNGDRMNGMYGCGYVSKQGIIKTVGWIIDELDSNVMYFNASDIEWPTDFEHIPYSLKRVYKKQITVKLAAFWTIFTTCILGTFFIICYVSMMIHYKGVKLISNSSPGNIIICIGCIFGYVAIISYGMENLQNYNYKIRHPLLFNIFCNFHIWIIPIIFTLIYVPLFERSYRLASITKQVVQALSFHQTEIKIFTNCHLYGTIIVCVLVDILLLITFSMIQIGMNKYMYSLLYVTHKREFVGNDPMVVMEYRYPVCETNWPKIAYFFYGSVVFYKLVQLSFGAFYSFKVVTSKLKFETHHHYETKWLLISIFISILSVAIIIVVTEVLVVMSVVEWDPSDLTLPYCIISFSAIWIMNIVFCCNNCPRLWAFFRGEEEEYVLTAEQQMKQKYKEYIKNAGVTEMESLMNDKSHATIEVIGTNSHLPSNEQLQLN